MCSVVVVVVIDDFLCRVVWVVCSSCMEGTEELRRQSANRAAYYPAVEAELT